VAQPQPPNRTSVYPNLPGSGNASRICSAVNRRRGRRSSGTDDAGGAASVTPSATGEREEGDLAEAARREAEDGIVRLVPDRVRADSTAHIEHDPEAEPHTGRSRRYTAAKTAAELSAPCR
jgi:hypothetical protein